MASNRSDKKARQVVANALSDGVLEHADGDTPEAADLSDGEVLSLVRRLQTDYRRSLAEVERLRVAAEEESEKLGEQRTRYEGDVEALREREGALVERERELSRRELDADTGFAARERQFWEQLAGRMDELRSDLRTAVVEVEEADIAGVRERVNSFQVLRSEIEEAFVERTRSLTEREISLERREQALQLDRRNLDAAAQQLEWEREDFENEKSVTLARERAAHEHERKAWDEQRRFLEAAAAELRTRIVHADEIERQAQFVDPIRISEERDELIDRLKAAHAELAARPDKEMVDDLMSQMRVLELKSKGMDAALDRARRLEEQLESSHVALESLRLVESRNDNLLVQKAALEADVEELRQTLGELSERRQESAPFQRCSAIDEDPDLQATAELWEPEGSLSDLVVYLRGCIAFDELYYDERTMRSFLAGMNMSKLHILQGISGTGKSSLPLALANAFGAECRTVEVQAAWRDRQDLLGYFNPFEHRYEESDFLTALYLAGSPRHARTPFFILLDEMNLAHPEQYLADVLSVLPRPQPERQLRVMNRANPHAPERFVDGMALTLPPNVWVVGTANHDETTVSFAPKTYDRAHVMELPTRHPEPIEGYPRSMSEPLSMRRLTAMFSEAIESDRMGARSCSTDFVDGLRPVLARVGVGWGSRLEGQLQQYAPVVTAAGGSVREAVDDFVSLKLLKKLEGRYDFLTSDLEEVRSAIERLWEELPGVEESPERMLAVIDRELQRVGSRR